MQAVHPGRARRRLPVLAATLGVGLVMTACSAAPTTAPATTAAAPPPLPAFRLLATADLGAGWVAAPPVGPPCPGFPTAGSLLGPGATAVRFVGPGGAPTVVEYAVPSDSVRTAYARTVGVLQRTPVCATTGGHVGAPNFVGVLPLPHYGDLSVCMVFGAALGSGRPQAGFEVVRIGTVLLVVASAGPAPLDVTTLQTATAAAAGRLAP